MAERPDMPEMEVAELLRRIIARRRRRRNRMALAGLMACAAVPLATSALWNPPTLLLWNASASAPIGLYRVHAGDPVRRGDMVVAWTPEPARSLAARRRYLPANVPLVKGVAASAGDRICAAGRRVSINGVRIAIRQKADAAGRPLPWWSGCRRLDRGEYLLLMDRADSFDGRYFGLTLGQDLVGRAVLLWAKPARGSKNG